MTARAERSLLAMVGDDRSIEVEVGRVVVGLLAGRRQAAERKLRELAERADPAQVELEVNAVGYALLQTDREEQALTVFELNTRIFPEAFNTWDSLGEAHMMLGNNDEAIRFYERSLELNPNNANAEAMIARIRGGARPPN